MAMFAGGASRAMASLLLVALLNECRGLAPRRPLPVARRRAPRAPSMISERQIPAYRQTMKLYESRTGVATLPASAVPSVGIVADGDGFLVNHSEEPLFTEAETRAVVDECEARAATMGGWTTARHANYPTTDVPLQELPRALEWFRERALPETLYPFLAQSYAYCIPSPKSLRVVDAFVVKYNATAGQSFLKPHRDGSVVSFNIALNSADDYEGGGTYVARLDEGIRSDRGHVLSHASGMLHGGHPITSGVRYILVCFVIVKDFANFAYRFYERVRDMDPADKEPLPEDAAVVEARADGEGAALAKAAEERAERRLADARVAARQTFAQWPEDPRRAAAIAQREAAEARRAVAEARRVDADRRAAERAAEERRAAEKRRVAELRLAEGQLAVELAEADERAKVALAKRAAEERKVRAAEHLAAEDRRAAAAARSVAEQRAAEGQLGVELAEADERAKVALAKRAAEERKVRAAEHLAAEDRRAAAAARSVAEQRAAEGQLGVELAEADERAKVALAKRAAEERRLHAAEHLAAQYRRGARDRRAEGRRFAERRVEAHRRATDEEYAMWCAATDAASGDVYYYHAETGETSWIWPPEKALR